MRLRRLFRRIFLILFGLSLLLVGNGLLFASYSPSAFASAFVTGSDPIDGSTVSKPPSIVHIYFNAPLGQASQANVYAFPPGGSANGELVNAGRSLVNATNARELDVPLLAASKLPQGSYEVRWMAVSLTDGRTTRGLIGFNLGQSSTGASGTPTLGPSTSNKFPQLDLQGTLSVAWDWLVLLALIFWVGILVTNFFILPRSSLPSLWVQTRKHSRSLQVFCLLALLAGEGVNLILRSTSFTQTLGEGGIDTSAMTQLVLHTNYGYFWLARVSLLALALLLLWWSDYRQRRLQDTASMPAPGQADKRFSQLRQQARPESGPEVPTSPRPTPLPARSQARVTGAVAANVSPVRNTTVALPRVNGRIEPEETSTSAPSPWSAASWLTLAGLIILTLALSNEIIQLTSLPISTGIFLWLSLAALAAWLGSLAYLGIALLPTLPTIDPDHHSEVLASMLKRATPLFLSAMGVLLVSDLFLGEATIQVPEQLVNTSYGLALLIRSVLLLLALIFTGYMLFFLLPRLQRQTVLLPVVDAELPARRARKSALKKTTHAIQRTLHTLSGLAATALVCTALMNFFAPPVILPDINYAALVNQSSSGSSTTPTGQTQQADGLSITLQVLPARVGVANTVFLALSDAQGKLVSGATVKLRINMQIMDMGEASASTQGNNAIYAVTFSAGQTFTMAGSWVIRVEIDRPDQQPVQLTFQVIVTN